MTHAPTSLRPGPDRLSPWSDSSLFNAIAQGRWEEALSALRDGADPHFPNTARFNIFHHCALAHDGLRAVQTLNALDPRHWRRLDALWPSKTPLMLAARSDSPEVALWLLLHGAASREEDAPRALALARESHSHRAAGAIFSFIEAEALRNATAISLPQPSTDGAAGSRGRL